MSPIKFFYNRQRQLQITDEQLCPYPALRPLFFFLSGSLPAALFGMDITSMICACGAAVCLCLSGIIIFPFNWKSPVLMTLGIGLTTLHVLAPWQTYQSIMPSPECYAEVDGIVTDMMLIGGDDLHWLDPQKKVQFSIQRIRLRHRDPWKSCRGTVLLCDKELKLKYGQHLMAQGSLRLPLKGNLPHQFNQRRYLKSKGITHCFFPINLKTRTAPSTSWRVVPSGLVAVRRGLLRSLLRGINGQENQALLAAITFGLKSGLSWPQKEQFRKSGMIHLFAVSGLHIGIIFSLLILLLNLCRMPFRWRYGITPIILLIYVLLTGAESSALRAWLMLSVWALSRSFYLPGKGINTVLAAALILLIINPLNLFQAGFQYSFLLVIAILTGWGMVTLLWNCLSLRLKLVPGRAQRHLRWKYRILQVVFSTAGAMAIFWLGGLGLTAWYGNMILPMSFFSNILVGCIAWGIMFLSWAKIFLGLLYIPWVPDQLGKILSFLIELLQFLARLVSANSMIIPVGAVSLVLIALYYVIFLWFAKSPLDIKPLFRRLALLIGIVGVIIVNSRFSQERTHVTILQGNGCCVPVICLRRAGRTVLINCGPKDFKYSLNNWLKGEGITTVNTLILVDGTRTFCGSLPAVMETTDIKAIHQLNGRQLSKGRLQTFLSSGGRYRHREKQVIPGVRSACIHQRNEGTYYTITVQFSAKHLVRIHWKASKHGGGYLVVGGHEYPLTYERDDRLVDSFVITTPLN